MEGGDRGEAQAELQPLGIRCIPVGWQDGGASVNWGPREKHADKGMDVQNWSFNS